jgi:putative transposase
MVPSQLRRLKELDIENARLKKMYADISLVHEAFKDPIEKSSES